MNDIIRDDLQEEGQCYRDMYDNLWIDLEIARRNKELEKDKDKEKESI